MTLAVSDPTGTVPGDGEPAVVEAAGLTRVYTRRHARPGLLGALHAFVRPRTERVEAVTDLDLRLHRGEIVGLLGSNGAGKTTTIKLLTGLLHPTSGRVRVLGHEPGKRSYDFRQRFAIVMGNRHQLWWELPAQESFLLTRELYGLDAAEYRRHLAVLTDLLDVGSLVEVPVRRLSLGERMKMELINALLHRPAILFLDEPTIGLDLVAQRAIRRFLREYRDVGSATILLTSHYMRDIEELCERVVVLDRGRKVYDGALDGLREVAGIRKHLTVRFAGPVSDAELDGLPARVVERQAGSLTLLVEARHVQDVSARIVSAFPVEDIGVSEQPVEDIVHDLFAAAAGRG